MEPMHSLLRRQLKRHFGDAPPPAEWEALLADVGAAYREFDVDREMLERSLELSSQELLQANSEMRAIFQAIPDLLFRIDRTGMILSFKVGQTGEIGVQARELAGRRIQEIADRSVAAQFDAAIGRVLADQAAANLEYSLAVDGERQAYEARLLPLPEEQLVVIIRNITARRRAENLRAVQNEVLELIAADAPLSGVLEKLARLVEAQCEGALGSILLFDPARSCLRPAAAPSLPPDYVAAIDPVPVGALCGSCGTAAHTRELVIVTDIATDPRWADWRELAARHGLRACWSQPILAPDGGLLGTFAVYYRESRGPGVAELELIATASRLAALALERRRAEERLRAEEERFHFVALATHDAIYDWDNRTGRTWRNETYQTLYSPNEPIGSEHDWWLDHVHPDDRARIRASLSEAFAHLRHLWSSEYRFRRSDGKYASVIDRGYILYDDQRPARMIGAMTDMTERKRLEEQFRQSQKMEAFGQLAGGVAHDFNNILTVIIGNTSLLRANGLTDAERVVALEETHRAAERAANLTRQLLTFSRRQPMELKPLNLDEVVLNMTRMFQRVLGEHIMLETRFSPGGAPILADAGMMEQALMNLAVNSRDAMPQGGRLTIETSPVAMTGAQLANRPGMKEGTFVRLSVRDTGTGIAPENLPHIFEPFFTTKQVGSGTGLGLATVLGIAEQHHGWVEVESRVGEGTAIRMFLPRARMPVRAVTAVPPPPVPRGGVETVLVVEDETAVRQWMRTLLLRFGYKVHCADSGVSALSLWPQLRATVDLLVTDVVMPGGIDGPELARRLRADKPELKVLFCSGYTDHRPGGPALGSAAGGLLMKPFGMHVFLQTVRNMLDARAGK